MIYIVILLILIDCVLMGVTYSHERELLKIKEELIDRLSSISIKLADIQIINSDIQEELDKIKRGNGVEEDIEEVEKAYIKGLNNLLSYHGEQQE